MRPVLLLLIALALALASACGSDGDSGNGGANDPSRTTAAGTASPTRSAATATPANPGDAEAVHTPDPGAPLYIALGDSLSAGVGASDHTATAFVPLVRDGLGSDVGLLNLGHSGDDSFEITEHGHLDEAIEVIRARNGDGSPGNDVILVTLEIGGNDLLDLYFSLVTTGVCPNVEEGLQKPVCVNAVREAFDAFTPNLRGILSSLREADPGLQIVLMTLYNPFSGGLPAIEPIGDLVLEGTPGTPFPEGLNDIIRAEGQAAGVTVVDLYPEFVGRAPEYVALDLIHPNDAGYRVMADLVLAAVKG